MKLTNKYIAEGMYVTNGKQIWKVINWDSKYRHALLQKIDKNGNKTDYFVVAENYELYGDENEALISWMNGDYLDDVSQSDAEEYFDDFYKKDKKINESIEKYFVGSKTWQGYDVYMIEDGKKYYLSKLAKNIEDSSWSSDFTYAKHWKDKSRVEEIVNMLNSELKESKKSIKERSEENEIIVSELQDTVEYFCGLYEEDKELKGNALKDLQNAIERLEVFNAIGSIYQWGVEVLNKCGIKYKGLKESKKVMNEKISSKYVYNFKNNGNYMISMFDDYNFEILAIPNDKSLFSKDLPKFKIEKTYIYEQYNDDIWLFVGKVEELGWCFIAFDKYANNSNVYAYQYGDNEKYAYIPFRSYILYLENKKVYRTHNIESKKSARKSLKESAKPINEKNVAKFVDELNKWCDDNVHYKDVDSARFTKQYGKLYDFEWGWDYSYGDKGDLLVFDKEETLDWYDDEVVVPFIKQLAKKYGWYCEPAHSYADFMFAEI